MDHVKTAESIGAASAGRRGLLWWLPPSTAAFIYTVLLRHPLLRKLAQRVIRLMIPRELEINAVTIMLNQEDAIVSGNLALGCYEVYNLNLFTSLVKPGMNVVDVGANIGLYSALAARLVGHSGKVFAIEPDATNCSFIEQTVRRNQFTNVTIVQKAAGDKCGQSHLYLCDTNKADHRIYDRTGTRKSVTIEMTTLDSLITEFGVGSVDVLKIDAQGAEPLVLRGMREMLRRNPKIKILLEFWPWGISQAGGSPTKFLEEFIKEGFQIFELQGDGKRLEKLDEIESIVSRDLERQHTNLYLEQPF